VSLKKNIFHNSIANIFQKIVRILEQLLLVPFFIASWGASYYGEWLTLTIIPSILVFSDLGFGSAAANGFVLRYASGDKQGAADILNTGFRIVSYAVILGIVLSIAVLFSGTYWGWFEKSLIPANDAVKAVSFMMAARLISFYNQLFSANFIAARKADLGINLLSINSILSILAGAAVLFLGGYIITYALWQFIVSVIFNLYYWWRADSILDLKKEYKGKYEKAFAKEIFSKGFGYMLSPIWQSVLFQGTTFVVRLTLGPVAVAVFNTVRTLSRSINQLCSIIGGSVFPELQFELGKENWLKGQKIYLYSIRSSFVLSLLGIIFLGFFGLPLYNIWTHKVLTPTPLMWFIFLVGILVNAVWWTSSVVFRAMNNPYQLSISGVIAAFISIAASYFLCLYWGLTGAAIGSLIFEIIMSVYILPLSCKMMNLSISKILKF